MAIIKIQPTGLVYDPDPPIVRHGEEVTFRLDGVPSATVTFENGSCFSEQGPFNLYSSSLAASKSEHTVTLTCPSRHYPFHVDIPADTDAQARLRRGEFETKKGDLEVTTDPPEDKDKKPRK